MIKTICDDITNNIIRDTISDIIDYITSYTISNIIKIIIKSRHWSHLEGGGHTCRSRGCSDTVCMACEQSRVWCRDTAPPCNLDTNSTIRSTKLLPGYQRTAAFLTQGAGLCGLRLQFRL